MPARRDLRHDTAVACVQIGLRRHHGGEHVAVVGDDGCGGLVARGLDPEYQDACSDDAGSRHMINASSRLSV
jgi:hypothetical protein